MTKLKVGVIQLNAGDSKQENLERVASLIQSASLQGAKLIALPETFNFRGTKEQAILNSENFDDDISVNLIKDLAQKFNLFILGGSIYARSSKNDLPFNYSFFVNPTGNIIGSYKKIHLFDVDIEGKQIRESAKTQAGSHPELVTTKIENLDLKLGLSICYDLRFPELFRYYANQNAHIIFVPSCFTKQTGLAHWHVLCRARAIENQAFVIAPNQVGKGAETICYGHSLIVDPWGNLLAEGNPEQEEIIYADLDFDFLNQVRKNLPSLCHRKL